MRFSRFALAVIAAVAAPVLAGPETATSVFGMPLTFEVCRARVSRALTADGFQDLRDFGNGWIGSTARLSASMGCVHGVNETVVVVTVSGADPVPARDHLALLVRSSAPAEPPTPVRAVGFRHAPDGDWSRAHPDSILNYISWDGSKWTAKLESDRFLHAPEGDWKRAHGDTILNHISWDGAKWTARIENGRFLHAPSGDFGKAHPDAILNYVTWDKTRWTARLE